MMQHEDICGQPRECHICQMKCATPQRLKRHVESHRRVTTQKEPTPETTTKERINDMPRRPRTEEQPGPSSYGCRRCQKRFQNRRELYLHGMREHFQVGGQLQEVPWGNQRAPWEEDNAIDERLRTVYEANAPLILQPNAPGPNISVYNFPAGNDVNEDQITEAADAMYEQQHHAFKLNLSFGVILRNRETGEYRYFRPFYNDSVLERPLYVSRRRDLRTLTLRLRRMDLFTQLLRNREDTRWIPVLVTNFRFTIFHTFYPIGDLHGPLPDYVKHNRAVISLETNSNTGMQYEDHYCAFRCLALHRGYDVKSLEGETLDLFNTWARYKGGIKDFKGITFEDLPDLESLFEINLEVYTLKPEGIAGSVYKSRGRREDTAYLHLYQGHFSYIQDFAMFAKKYQCKFCDKLWEHHGNYIRHEQKCKDKTRYVYPGGFYSQKKSVFEELSYFGIGCTDRVYTHFITFDFESILKKVQNQRSTKMEWTQEHVPTSVSICSNVPGFLDPHCIVNSDADDLVREMIEYMQGIATTAKELNKEKWGQQLYQLEQKIQDSMPLDEDDEGDACEIAKLKQLYGKLKGYIRQIPVLGFNSAKYDLNLIKTKVAKHLGLHEEEFCFTIKKEQCVCVYFDGELEVFGRVGTGYILRKISQGIPSGRIESFFSIRMVRPRLEAGSHGAASPGLFLQLFKTTGYFGGRVRHLQDGLEGEKHEDV